MVIVTVPGTMGHGLIGSDDDMSLKECSKVSDPTEWRGVVIAKGCFVVRMVVVTSFWVPLNRQPRVGEEVRDGAVDCCRQTERTTCYGTQG